MRLRDILHLSLLDIRNRRKTTTKLFVLFLVVVFFMSSFILYISMLDGAVDRLLNEEKENRELILRNSELILPLGIDIAAIHHKHIKGVEEKYFSIIFESKVDIKVNDTIMTGRCGQLDFTSQKHELAGEMRYLAQDEVIIGEDFARNIGIRDIDSYIGKSMTLIISGHDIFTKKIAGICEGMQPITVANSAAEEIGKIITVTNWIFVEVDDYGNKEEVKNYLLDTFNDTNVISSVDNEDNLIAINSHRRLMSRIFLSIGLVVFVALIVCVVFIMLIDSHNKRRFTGTVRAIGMTSKEVYLAYFIRNMIVFSVACAFGYLIAICVAFGMLGVMESMFAISFRITFSTSQIALWCVFVGGILVNTICLLIMHIASRKKSIVETIREL